MDELKFIETHCHLDYLKAKPLDEIIDDSFERNIEKIVTIAVEPKNFQSVIDIANSNKKIYCTQGIHPHEANQFKKEHLEEIKENLKNHKEKIVAVGEIGLDYYYDHSDRKTQREVFETFLGFAEEVNLPVVIHSRDAEEDTIDILKNFNQNQQRVRGVIHSFTSKQILADKSLEMGFFIGVNGIVTFKNAQNVRDVIQTVPVEKIVLETDSPYLSPVPKRGKENNPSHLPYIFDFYFENMNKTEMSQEELAKNFYDNSINLFF